MPSRAMQPNARSFGFFIARPQMGIRYFSVTCESSAILSRRRIASGRFGKVPTKRRQDNYLRRDGTPAKRITVPIFTLIPFQRFANKFSLNPVIQRREKMIREDFDKSVARLPRVRG